MQNRGISQADSSANVLRRLRRPSAGVVAVALGLLAWTPAVRADVVTDWNAVAEAVAPRFGAPQQQSRVQAMVQIAVHDALNAIESRYARYAWNGRAARGASPDAAVAAASRQTLLILLAPLPDSPAKAAAIASVEAAFVASVGTEPYDASTRAGIDAGVAAANAILALRVGDHSDTPNLPYTLPPGPGVYQPTPNPEFPAVITPSFAGWAHVTPFTLRHGSQFGVEAGEIFNVTGRAYGREYEEVRQVGDARVRGALPDSEESDVARFWPGGGSNWNLTARDIVAGRGFDRWQHARLFALLNIAQADALIANQFWKYTYNFWRPVTAIRWVDDGNPATTSDPIWRPFLVTPPYPDYPCALPSATPRRRKCSASFSGPIASPSSARSLPPPCRCRHRWTRFQRRPSSASTIRCRRRWGRPRWLACMQASTSGKDARSERGRVDRLGGSSTSTNCGRSSAADADLPQPDTGTSVEAGRPRVGVPAHVVLPRSGRGARPPPLPVPGPRTGVAPTPDRPLTPGALTTRTAGAARDADPAWTHGAPRRRTPCGRRATARWRARGRSSPRHRPPERAAPRSRA